MAQPFKMCFAYRNLEHMAPIRAMNNLDICGALIAGGRIPDGHSESDIQIEAAYRLMAPASGARMVITYVEGSIEAGGLGCANVEPGWYVIPLRGDGLLDLTRMDGPLACAGDAEIRYIDLEEEEATR